MNQPPNYREQQEARHQDALKAALERSAGKLAILFVIDQDNTPAVQSAVNPVQCRTPMEADNWLTVGDYLAKQFLQVWRQLCDGAEGALPP